MGLHARMQVRLRAYLSARMYRVDTCFRQDPPQLDPCLVWSFAGVWFILFRPIGHNLWEVGFRLPPPHN